MSEKSIEKQFNVLSKKQVNLVTKKTNNFKDSAIHSEERVKTPRRISFKESLELKQLDKNLIILEDRKLSLENNILEGLGDIAEQSIELANVMTLLEEAENRWLELSELKQ